MIQPLLHSRSKSQLLHYVSQSTHGLVLIGPSGAGKYYVAQWLADQLSTPYITVQAPEDKQTITIEQVRELYSVTRTGSTLVIIIKNAHQLSREAQNAFLKLLEEPPKNTKFILTTQSVDSLLPTILSRTQHITILQPSAAKLSSLHPETSSLSEQELKSLIHTTGHLPGKVSSLLTSSELLEKHSAAVTEAKLFYVQNPYERNLVCISNKFEKQWAEQLLNLLAIIIQSLIKQNADNTTLVKKLTLQANVIEITANNLLHINGNPKIHLTKLCQQL